MTTPNDPWSREDIPPLHLAQSDDVEDTSEDDLRDEAGEQTYDRLSSDALTVPIHGGATRPLSWSRAAPRKPHLINRQQRDHSPVATLFLGIAIGAIITSVLAAVIIAGMANSLHSANSVGTTPKSPRPLPTVTATRIPTATPVPAVAATYTTTDTTTQGSWQGVYGSQGAIVLGDTQQLPAGVQVAASGETGFVWAPTTPDPRAPQKLSNPADRVAACWYAFTAMTIDVNITDGQAYRVALYVLDWDSINRSEVITVSDPATGAALDTRIVTSFSGGQYLVWTIRGHVTLQITNNAGSANAVVSGIFFANA